MLEFRGARLAAIVAAAVGAFTTAGGCASDEQGVTFIDRQPCTTDTECSAGWVCENAECSALCNGDGDCPAKDQACDDGVCFVVAAPECASDDTCSTPGQCDAPGLPGTCSGGRCHYTPMSSMTPCDDGEPCTGPDECDGLGVCVPQQSLDCGGYQCQIGGAACLSACTSDAQCAIGFFCAAPNCLPKTANGGACTVSNDCQSGFCDGRFCCDAGPDCCQGPADCPPSYSAASTCTDPSSTTDCQGTAIGPTCVDNVCGSAPVNDDSACDGAQRACLNNIAPVLCTAAANQPVPVCRTACTIPQHCVSGFDCVPPDCVLPQGAGASCGGPMDPQCDGMLTCVEGVCCTSACLGECQSCLNALTDQPDGLCADIRLGDEDMVATNTCLGTGSGCGAAACACDGSGACKVATGASCMSDGDCATGDCECADNACVASLCADEDCADCEFTTTGATCDGDLGNSVGCDDGDLCTENDTCGGGTCNGGSMRDCDDSEECTNDGCDPMTGCTHSNVADDTQCGPNYCDVLLHVSDTCTLGVCNATNRAQLADCNDGDPCTVDSCASGGCTNTPDTTPPSITSQPGNDTACAGSNATFSVAASGLGLTYQWQVDSGSGWNNVSGGAFSGGTTSTLTVTTTAGMDGDRFRAIVDSPCSSATNSNAGTLTVNTAPQVTTDVVDDSACPGANASFSVAASGASLSYQWQENTGSGWSAISNGGVFSGATTAILSLTGVTGGMNGNDYRVVVSGACTPSDTSSGGNLTVLATPSITGQPSAVSVCQGNSTSFTASGAGAGVTYRWQSDASGSFQNLNNNMTYSGVTTGTLSINNASIGLNGDNYRLRVSGTCGSPVNSNSATLTVNAAPSITLQPTNQTECETAGATFTANASGPGVTYQWQRSTNGGGSWSNLSNGGGFFGVTTTSLSINSVTLSMDGDDFRMVAAGICSPSATSNGANLDVVPEFATCNGGSGVCTSGVCNACYDCSAPGCDGQGCSFGGTGCTCNGMSCEDSSGFPCPL